MCGRMACCLCEERYVSASSFYDNTNDEHKLPRWDNSSCLQFYPSVNKAPTEVTPVLLWDINNNEYILKPMVWGIIPPWHKGDYKNVKLSTNNARIETLKQSSLYKVPLKKGRRCVILCEGFYEWQTAGKTKQPYFIYNSPIDDFRPEEKEHWMSGHWSPKLGWVGPVLLKMAGLYSQWESCNNEIIDSYAVITKESNESLSWLHYRMPAILTPEQEKDWLNIEDVNEDEALNLLEPVQKLSWHPVSTLVNNSRNKQPHLNQPIELNKKTGSSKIMETWLKSSNVKREIKIEPSGEEINKKLRIGK